jgi:ABC-type proline/glycine betaine transport system substrate-binding protein
MNKDILIIAILIILNIISMLIGYLLGRLGGSESVSIFEKKPKDKNKVVKTDVDIDETKYVINIKTEGLEKKYGSLGDIKQSQENIQNSVNKLKNMKG